MNRTRIFIVAIAALLTAAPGQAFDGKRRGFLLGFGVGYTPLLEWTRSSDDATETKTAFTLSLPIGYGWDDHNAIAYVPATSSFNSALLGGVGTMQGIWSLRWYHYFGETDRSIVTSLGPGRMMFNANDGLHASGLGFIAGGGYEFTRHLQVELYYAAGRTSHDDEDFNHQILTLQVTAMV